MEDKIEFPLEYSNRWISYFDLLGFSEMVNTESGLMYICPI